MARLDYLILGFSLILVVYILCFIRWRLLLKSIGIHPPWKRLLISYFGGIFFNLFLPSTIGGDLVRVMDLTNHLKRTKEIAASVLIDRLIGFTALGLIALLAVISGYRYVEGLGILRLILILFIFLFSMITVLFTKNIFAKIKMFIPTQRLKSKAENLHAEIFYFRKRPQVLLKALGISFLTHFSFIISFYFIFLALQLKLNIIYIFIFLPIISVVAMIPISIGGLGLRDAGSVFFFAKVGIAKDAAVAASLLNFSFIAAIGVLCGVIYVIALYNRWLQRR